MLITFQMQFVSSDEEEELTLLETQTRKIRYDPYRDKMLQYFLKAKAPKTVQQYLAAYERCKKWAVDMNISVLPMEVDDLICYLIYISENVESFAAVKMARYGIAYVHQMAGKPYPTKDPAINLIMEASKRMWAKPVKKAKPMTFEIIKMLVDDVLGQDVYRTSGHFKISIVDWRTVINIIVKFCYIARNSDVLELTRRHFTFVKDLLVIHFPKAKNDQFFEGSSTTFEAKSSRVYCPVFLMAKYFERLGYGPKSNGFFLPKVGLKKIDRVKGKSIFTQVALPNEHMSSGSQEAFGENGNPLQGVHRTQ